jgi:hypothetical protein
MKMKNITKIIIAVLLAMSLVAWGSPSEARDGHYRSGHSKVYNKADRSQYQRGYRNQRFYGYHHNYSRQPYYRFGYKYKPNRTAMDITTDQTIAAMAATPILGCSFLHLEPESILDSASDAL